MDVSKMGSRLKHHDRHRDRQRSPDHIDRQKRGDHHKHDVAIASTAGGRSPAGDPSPADASSKEYILHVPPLNPVLHLHHHHHPHPVPMSEHHQHHDHNASHHYPPDYHPMLHYNVMRNKPSNVSLVVMQWSPPAVRVSWHFNESEHGVNLHTKFIPKKLEAFRLTYHPMNSR